MKLTSAIFIICFICINTFSSCDRLECRNSNPIFLTNEIGSEEYNKELVRQLNKPKNHPIRCWFEKYIAEIFDRINTAISGFSAPQNR